MPAQDHKPTAPPAWIDKLLEWFCAPELLEEVLGDLHERYYLRVKKEGVQKARKSYWREVLAYMRYSIFKGESSQHNHPIFTSMLQNHFNIARRNVYRNKAYSLINVLGLALGITCAILIFTLVKPFAKTILLLKK